MPEESDKKSGATKWDAFIFLLDKLIDKAHIGTLIIVFVFCFVIYSMTRNLESEDSRILIEQFIVSVFGGDRRSLVIWILVGSNLFTIVLASRKSRQQLREIRRLATFRDAYISYKNVVLNTCYAAFKTCGHDDTKPTVDDVKAELEVVLDGLPLDVAKKSSKFSLE
ncbi:MAG: hypothetical protein KDA66_18665 [Planctomycetaceae bacterium]|nr:hypothetical protein [Planctomycetaceae bacterium]